MFMYVFVVHICYCALSINCHFGYVCLGKEGLNLNEITWLNNFFIILFYKNKIFIILHYIIFFNYLKNKSL